MTISRRRIVFLLTAALIFLGNMSGNVSGLPEFRKAFLEKYAGPDASPEYRTMVRKANCNVCHVPNQPRKEHNAYGEELRKLIPGDAQERKKEARKEGRQKEEAQKLISELREAFEKVAAMKNEEGETYGDRIKAGKLPVEITEEQLEEDEDDDS